MIKKTPLPYLTLLNLDNAQVATQAAVRDREWPPVALVEGQFLVLRYPDGIRLAIRLEFVEAYAVEFRMPEQ